ncbi:EAL domain-containing protein, partial [Neptuniibacter sp. UBA847]|uniref:EAL domain-containing protein n=3 Tax=Neptuniibacter TaxID=459520 RepID=UPI0025DC4283
MRSINASKTTSFAKLIYGGLFCFVCLIFITLAFSYDQSLEERNHRAKLYAQMIESTLSRTLEAMEVTLTSLSNELITDTAPSSYRQQLLNRLKFAPHLRQIVIIKNNKTLIDTRHQPAVNINETVLGFDREQINHYSLGLMIGKQIRGRYLPYQGYFPDEGEHVSLVPIGLDFTDPNGESYRFIAAFNPEYVKRFIRELPLHELDSVYVTDLESTALIQHGLYGPVQPQVHSLIKMALSQSKNMLQSKELSYFSNNTITVRFSEKYPLAISVLTNHRGSLEKWIKEKKNLLMIVLIVTVSMFFGAVFVIRKNYAALEMKEEVHLLSEVVEHTPTGVVITNAEGIIQYVNQSFERVTGYKKSEVIGENPRIFKSGDKSEQEYLDMWNCLASGQTWLGEFHNKRKDGSYYWERASIGALKDSTGEITHFIALKQPIDDEKAAQEKLRLASTVFDAAIEAIMVTNTDRVIETVNPAFQRITGYTEKEVIGNYPSILKSGKHSNEFYDDLYMTLKERGAWQGEIWNRRKNGEVYPQWLMISSRRDLDGKLEGYVAMFSDITKRKADEALIRQQANYDSVTSLPNRNLFTDRLNQALALTDRNHSKTALLFIDLDRFKYVNDTYGHHIGDLLLKSVADRLKDEIRKSDTVARLGGDEFAVIISNVKKPAVVETVARKILTSLSAPFNLESYEAHISCSIGIAFYPDHSTQAESLIIHADSAMYRAKQSGRNTYEYYNEDLSKELAQRRDIEKDLYQALDKNEFFLEYQPIWNIEHSKVESIEALIRWNHPEKGIIYPDAFIPLSEESDLILQIGEWVIDHCCEFAQQLQRNYSAPPKVSLNVSSLQFMKSGLILKIEKALADNNIKGYAICIEITESVLLIDQKNIEEQLTGIRSMGIEISVDDFGTGFSSLSYLKKYPINRIKIDKSFIDDLEKNSEDRTLVSGMISLANSLSLKTIVEGVESDGQLAIIQQYGNPMIQGYLFNRPMREDRLLMLL